jgi:hypothetical protein
MLPPAQANRAKAPQANQALGLMVGGTLADLLRPSKRSVP